MTVPINNFSMFGTSNTTIQGAVVQGGGAAGSDTTFTQLISHSNTAKFDPTYNSVNPGQAITNLNQVTHSLQYRNYPWGGSGSGTCGMKTITGTYTPSTAYTYPAVSICDAYNLNFTATVDVLGDRPNLFTFYNSNGLQAGGNVGWQGTATWPGPWGNSVVYTDSNGVNYYLNGTIGPIYVPLTFTSTSGRYLIVQAGSSQGSVQQWTDAWEATIPML